MEEKIYSLLKEINDLELGINIVDLGLIYEVDYNESKIDIRMTMTSPSCPLHMTIREDIEGKLKKNFNCEIHIELVWDPPWHGEMMSDDARKRLGF